jgi:hypothetical protein
MKERETSAFILLLLSITPDPEIGALPYRRPDSWRCQGLGIDKEVVIDVDSDGFRG